MTIASACPRWTSSDGSGINSAFRFDEVNNSIANFKKSKYCRIRCGLFVKPQIVDRLLYQFSVGFRLANNLGILSQIEG